MQPDVVAFMELYGLVKIPWYSAEGLHIGWYDRDDNFTPATDTDRLPARRSDGGVLRSK